MLYERYVRPGSAKIQLKTYLIAGTLLASRQTLRSVISTSNFVGRNQLVEAHAVVLLVTFLNEVLRGQLQELVGRSREVSLNVVHDQWAVLGDLTVLFK